MDTSHLHDRAQTIVAGAISRIVAGEAICADGAVAEAPDLTGPLRTELSRLQMIQAAGERAIELGGAHTVTFSPELTPPSTKGLFIRCPHCQEQFETPIDTPLPEITCNICGKHFSLAGTDAETRNAAALASLGHFELIERIGIGGFGTVWKGRDRKLDRVVAIKIPRRGSLDPTDTEMFLREARAAAQLNHPYIVGIHEVGLDRELVFIVSEYVRGTTLEKWLGRQRPTVRQAVSQCIFVAEALHHAHEHGVIHRDLKPGNIMIGVDGRPRVMDFGLARRDAGEVTMTLDGQLLGTPAYMSPEQALGKGHEADRRSDVYSLGVIFFELLTGERPFRGEYLQLIEQVVQNDPPSPRALNGSVPRDLETITLKCLEKDPARRFQSALELEDELRRFLRGEPIFARPIGRLERGWRWAKREPALAGLCLGVAILSIVSTIAAAGFLAGRQELADALTLEQELRADAEDAADREAELRRQTELHAAREAEMRRHAQEASALEASLRQDAQAAEARAKTLRSEAEKAADRETDLLREARESAHRERKMREDLEVRQAKLVAATKAAEQQAAVAEAERRKAAQALDDASTAHELLEQELYFSTIANAEFGMFLGEVGQVRQTLDAYQNPQRWEWRMLSSKCDESIVRLSVSALTGKNGTMGSVPDVCAWDPSGRLCAIGGSGGHGIHLFDPALRTASTVTGPYGTPDSVDWSSDGTMIAVVSNGAVLVFDREGKVPFRRFESNPVGAWNPVSQDFLAPRGTRNSNQSLALFRPIGGTFNESKRLPWPKQRKLYHAAWSGDGERLALLFEDGGLKLQVLSPTGKLLWTAEAWSNAERQDRSGPPACMFSPSGHYLAVIRGDHSRVRVFNALSGDSEYQFQGDPIRVQAACWGPAGDLLAVAGASGFVSVWNIADRLLARKLSFSANGAESVAWSKAHSALLAVDGCEQLALWPAAATVPNRFRYAIGNPAIDPQLFWSANSRLLTVAHTALVTWDAATGSIVNGVNPSGAMELIGPTGKHSVRMEIPDGSNYPSRLTSLRLVDVRTQADLGVLDRRDQLPHVAHTICWSQDGRYVAVSAGDKSEVPVYDVVNATLRSTVSSPVGATSLVKGISFSPNASRVAVAFGTGLIVTDTSTGRTVFKDKSMPAMKMSWSPCGEHLVVGGQGQVAILDAEGKVTHVIQRAGINAGSPTIPPGGSLVAILTDVAGVPELYDVATGRHIMSFHGMEGRALAWSPDGNSLAIACNDGCVEVVRAPTQKELSKIH